MAAAIRVGTCSWADEASTKYWYPKGVPPGERLRYYAEHFDTVEVDSTYYRLPVEEMVERWAERTPEGFVMHVKAFGVMTRHPVKVEQLPPDLRDEAPKDDRGRVDRPSREFRGEIFRRFPRRSSRFAPPEARRASVPVPAVRRPEGGVLRLPRLGREQVEDDKMLVEFSHRSWLDDIARRRWASSKSTGWDTSSSTRRARRARTSR